VPVAPALGGCTLATDHVDTGSRDASAGGSAADAAPGGGGDPADGAPAGSGLLTVAASTPQVASAEPIDFSAAGDADWVHWGLDGNVAAYNHRAGVTPSISNYV